MRTSLVSLLPFAVVGLLSPLRAVVVYNGNSAANNLTAPTGDQGWSYVGVSNSSVGSFVYLGNYGGGYWAISAAHVIGATSTSVSLNGTNYGIVSGSATRLTDGLGNPVDLTVFRLDANPGLANLEIASSAPGVGTSLTYVGYGALRDNSLTYWDSSTNPWTVKAGPGGADKVGYNVSGAYTKSWGINTLAGGNQTVNIGQGNTKAFYSTFAQSNGSSMLFRGDSGGGTFSQIGGVWTLVGINDAISTYTNQDSSTMAVVGDGSYSVDLSVYRSQIFAAVPEPSTYGLVAGGAALSVAASRRFRRRVA